MIFIFILFEIVMTLFVPSYQTGEITLLYVSAGTSTTTTSFSPAFVSYPQLVLSWTYVDVNPGPNSYYSIPSSINQNSFILTTTLSQSIVLIKIWWMAFLDDNIFSFQGYHQVTYPPSLIILPISSLAYVPSAALFLNGITQSQTESLSTFGYYIIIYDITSSYIKIGVGNLGSGQISDIYYSIIYGNPQFIFATDDICNELGTYQLSGSDTNIKVWQVGISGVIGSNRLRIKIDKLTTQGEYNSATWANTVIDMIFINYFAYMPCPTYCTTCYAVEPACDSCIVSTQRRGSDCTSCQPHMFLLSGQLNCQSCGIYCDECTGSAAICIACLPSTYRISPPTCTTCSSQMFVQSGVTNCQQCVTYCNECMTSSSNCLNCQASTFRSVPPSCTTCPISMYIQVNVDNCQLCSIYCDSCQTSANNCTQCKITTFRVNPPSCSSCPTQMFAQIGIVNCQQCGSYCGSCSLNANNCTICLTSTYRTNPPTCEICQSQYYLIQNLINCQPCANYCNACSSAANSCTSCQIASLRSNPPYCDTCPEQHYVAYSIHSCQQCPSYCNNCQNYTSLCIACSSASQRLNPPFCMDCPEHTYINGATCTYCDSSCQTCNQFKCLTCLSQQYLNYIGRCVNCPQHCLTCDSNSCFTCAGTCQICNLTSCLQCSSDNYYISGSVCHLCPENCLTCGGSYCLTCVVSLILINNQCQCQSPCLTCNQSQCLTCISPDYRVQGYTCYFCPQDCIACDQLNNCYMEPQNCQRGTYLNHYLIQCTKCQSNYYLTDDNQCIQCSPQCLECADQSHNCTICRFQEVSQQECQLCESHNGYYSDYETNNCFTVCGDGLISEYEECDDLNQVPLDGCSNCQIDPGYYCNGLFCDIIGYPVPVIYQNLTLDSIYNSHKQFVLQYNMPLLSQTMNLAIEISNQAEFAQNLEFVNSYQYTISINLSKSIIGAQIQVVFLNTSEIISDKGSQQQINSIQYFISDYIIISQTEFEVSATTNTIMQWLFIILIIIICLSVFFGGLNIFWNLLDVIQIISYLKYINTVKPYYLNAFFSLFDFIQFQNLPLNQLFNMQNYVQNSIGITEFKTTPLFINNDGYTSSTIINCIPIFNVILTGMIIYYCSRILLLLNRHTVLQMKTQLHSNLTWIKFLYNFKLYALRSCNNITKQWIWSGLIRIFTSSAFEICFMISLGLYGIQFESSRNIIKLDSYIGILTLLLYFTITMQISMIANLNNQTLKVSKNIYGTVFEGLRLSQIFMKQFNMILLIKKLLFMILLVLLYNEPLFQIMNIIFIQVSQILYLRIIDPIKNSKEKQKQQICETFILIAEIQLALLVVDDYWSWFTYEIRRIICWICIFALVTIILTQLYFDISQQVELYYKNYPLFRKYLQDIKGKFLYRPKHKSSIDDLII